jgi:hypothetical protein
MREGARIQPWIPAILFALWIFICQVLSLSAIWDGEGGRRAANWLLDRVQLELKVCSVEGQRFSLRTQVSCLKMYNDQLNAQVSKFILFIYSLLPYMFRRGRDSSVGIATGYGLGGPGIESRWVRDFSHKPRPALGSTQAPVQWATGLPRG